jgi:hypothetical protein
LTDMKIKATDREVRKFGLMFSAICLAVAGYSAYRGGAAWPWFLGGGALFLAGGLFVRSLLKHVYVAWMKFAFVLGWVNTRLILGIFFYGVLTPIGVIMRLSGWDPLTRKLDRSAQSYWVKRQHETFDPKKYERLL